MKILIFHMIISYDKNISLIFFVKDGSHVRLRHPSCVYITAQRQYTLQYKRCIHLWNNFLCIIALLCIFFDVDIELNLFWFFVLQFDLFCKKHFLPNKPIKPMVYLNYHGNCRIKYSWIESGEKSRKNGFR